MASSGLVICLFPNANSANDCTRPRIAGLGQFAEADRTRSTASTVIELLISFIAPPDHAYIALIPITKIVKKNSARKSGALPPSSTNPARSFSSYFFTRA